MLELKNSTMIILIVKQGPDRSVKLCPLTRNYKHNFHAENSEVVAEGREGGPLSLIRAGFVQVCLSSPLRLRHISKE